MKSSLRFVLLCIPFLVCAGVHVYSLDREAFSITKYDLDVRIEPQQHRLGARGKITLQNDSPTPQKIAVLQVSSALDWRSIKAGEKSLQFVSQDYASDIDHTGALSEVIVTLPQAIQPKSTVDLEVAYEGVIVLDATRLTAIGIPESTARETDWDQVSSNFTALRGVGYVTWYPIATEAASLTEGSDLFEIVARWKAREAGAAMRLQITLPRDEGEPPELLVNATSCPVAHEVGQEFLADCTYRSLGSAVPTLVISNYEVIDRPSVSVHFMRGHDLAAVTYADAAEKVAAFLAEWFGPARAKAETADLNDPNAAPFESGSLLLTPLSNSDPKLSGLVAAHQLTHAAFFSSRPWINEGLAHFAQALYLEHQSGRQAALDYMKLHSSAFSAAKIENPGQAAASKPGDDANRSLINTYDEGLYRSKAMCVWWMLRDMIGDSALKKALASYHAADDNEPSYMQRLIQAQTKQDLEWFFDDWIYRNRGLPEFKVASAFARKTLPEGYMLAITIDNLGGAGAEVPLTVKFTGGEVTKRLVVRGKSSATIRVEVPQPPQEVVVNGGSVPEKDPANNVFKIEADSAKPIP